MVLMMLVGLFQLEIFYKSDSIKHKKITPKHFFSEAGKAKGCEQNLLQSYCRNIFFLK